MSFIDEFHIVTMETHGTWYKWVASRHFTSNHIRRWVSHRQSPWKHRDGVQIIKRNIRDEKRRPTWWEKYKCTTCLTAEEAVMYALVKLNIISNSCFTEVLADRVTTVWHTVPDISHNVPTTHPMSICAPRKWTDMKVRVRIVTNPKTTPRLINITRSNPNWTKP